jgi:hypothetical protein
MIKTKKLRQMQKTKLTK